MKDLLERLRTAGVRRRQRADVNEWIAKLLRPPPLETVSQWAERVVVIPGPQTPSPGQFSLRGREFAREWLDTFNLPGVTDCAAVTGSQVSKTTTLSIGLLWSVANAPCSCLVVMPNADLARSYSETRLQPIIEATADLARMVPRGTDRHAYKVAQMQIGGAVIALVGSNSPSNLASRPVRLLLCDETDKFAPASSRESDAISLAEQRTKAFANPQRWRTSTPTLPSGRASWPAISVGTRFHACIARNRCSSLGARTTRCFG